MRDYDGKCIWIIGASSGIGRALALEVAAQGALLALSARSEDKLRELNAELGGGHYIFPLDICDADAVVKTAQEVNAVFPVLASVVLMAAGYSPVTLDKLDISVARQIVDTNITGAFHVVHAVLPVFKRQKRGQLALCASVAGYCGLPVGQPYSATKAAVINLAESLKAEQPHLDIKVINPGFVRTPMTGRNDFKMPMIIEAEDAARVIAKGLNSGAFEIHFPRKFTLLMKMMRALPYCLYFWLLRRFLS